MKKFLKTMAIYFFGNVASRLLSVVMLPLYTGMLSPSEYGEFDLKITIVGVIAPILFIEIWMGILRFLYDYDNIKDKQKVISTGFSLSFIALFVFSLLFLIMYLVFKFDYAFLIYLYGLSYILHSLLSYTIRGLGYNSVYVWSGVIGSVFMLVSNVLLLVVFKLRIEALLFSSALSYLAPVIFMEVKTKVFSRFRFKDVDKRLFKSLFIYCLPLSVNSISYWLTTSFNRVIISDKLGLAANGEFAIATKFTTIIMLIVTVFNLAWQETAYAMGNDANRGEKYTKVLKYYNRFIGCGVLLIIPVTSIIFPFMVNSAYNGAKNILPIYYMATFLSTIAGFMGSVICADKRTGVLFVSTVAGAGVSIGSLFLLMPIIGLQAATISLLLSFLTMVIIRLYVAKKRVGVQFDYKFAIVYCGAFALTSYVFLNFSVSLNALMIIPLLGFCGFMLRDLIKSFLIKIRRV
jgi:O-antigen/teichoic acid export membrane protein